MNYSQINKALAKEFGAGQVELRKAQKGAPWAFTLWFKADNPAPSVVSKAKRIVARFEPSKWFDDLAFHSE
ncbi:MAG TPA: hypothetical protein V6D48_19340 [Oculatellaceae cyanobacterium]